MATVTIRLDDGTREDLEDLARTSGVTVSVLLRDQINALLGRDVQMQKRSDVPHSLSMQQRLILAQQHEILAQLAAGNEDQVRHHCNMASVLHEGFAGEYDSVFAPVIPELSRTECNLVWDILDMFRVLARSVGELVGAERDALSADVKESLLFSGFDLNDSLEARLLGYVRYLTQTDRWTEVVERLHEIGDGGNSHHPCLPRYRRMLDAYRFALESRKKIRGHGRQAWLLAADDLQRIAAALPG